MPFIPISDENYHYITPYVTWFFVFINLAVAIFSFFLPEHSLELFYKYLGVVPAELWGVAEPAGVIPEKVTLLTSAFLHAGMAHFFFNMLFFVIFADNIEHAFGVLRYFLFCVAAALITSIAHALYEPNSTIPSLGFSGVVTAVLGAYIVLYPRAPINLLTPLELFIFLRRPGFTFQLPAWLIIGMWFSQDLVGLFFTPTDPNAGGIAFVAHISGFIFGLLTGRLLRVNYGPYELNGWHRPRRRSSQRPY